jgi:hypothetical protein
MSRESALLLCVRLSPSMTVRHLASRVSCAMRAAAFSGSWPRDVGACVRTGQRAITDIIRECCADTGSSCLSGLDVRCLREAVGAVAVHRIQPSDIHAWDSFARLAHLTTLIVAGAVNCDTWRAMTMENQAKRRYIYFTILATTDAWAIP